MSAKTTKNDQLPPQVGAAWVWVRERWPIIALTLFVVLGTIAFIVGGNLINDVKAAQKINDRQTDQIQAAQVQTRRLNCAIAKAITANPIVRIPEFQTEDQFHRQVVALRLILALSHGLDCGTVLGPVIKAEKNKTASQQPEGGGALTPQASGSQIPGQPSSPSSSGAPAQHPASPPSGGGSAPGGSNPGGGGGVPGGGSGGGAGGGGSAPSPPPLVHVPPICVGSICTPDLRVP